MAREPSPVSICAKYTLFFENFIIWILGLAVTSLGTYILVIKEKKVHDPIDFFFDPSTLMCTAGSITCVITFVGWMGALREYTSFLRLYNWIMTLLFIGELVLIVFVFIFYFVPNAKQQLNLFPEKTFKEAIKKYGIVEDDDMKNLIDNMQESLECCGFSDTDTGFLDWNENEYFNCTEPKTSSESCSVPPSCCKLAKGDMKNVLCGRDVMQYNTANFAMSPSSVTLWVSIDSSDIHSSDPIPSSAPIKTKTVDEAPTHNPIYTVGCLKAVGTFINDHALVIGGIMLAILLPQMYFMYLAQALRRQILEQKSKWTR